MASIVTEMFRRRFGGKSGEDFSKWISYQVYATANSTRALFSNSDLTLISRMMMGDTEITPAATMTFAEAGNYDFKILLVDPTTIPNNAFNAGHYRNVVLPSCVTYIDTNAFRNYNANAATSLLTCLATTPPALNGDPFANRHAITVYVPSASLTAYQTAWSMMSNIQALTT